MQQLKAATQKWFTILGALTLVVAQGAAAQNSVALQAAVAQAGGRVIVTLKSTRNNGAAIMAPGSPAVASDELQQITGHLGTAYAADVIRSLPATSMVVANIDPAQVGALLADANVAAVEPDRVWFAADVPSPNDRWSAYKRTPKADTTPWGVAQVAAPAVWAMGNKGDNVKVAVLDSGGDPNHPDLSYTGGYDAVNGNSANWSDDVGSCNGHGTHIAGTIAAKDDGVGIVGVAPHVRLYAIKVFQDISGSCGAYTSVQIAGLNWAVTQGIRLVNVSIAGTYSAAYDAAMATAAASGTYVFAAAGNNGGAVTFPGSSTSAFAIAALDNTNTRASFSDFGPEVDFSAPGVSITSTMPGGGYGDKSGTSMATPHAVGVAALILSANPSFSFAQLRQKLIDGALDLETGGFDNNTGYGLLRAANSLAGQTTPLAFALSPNWRRATVLQGGSAASDNAAITFTGTGASTAAWTATKRKSWTTLTTASGNGSGTVAWNRNATGLAVGTYVDTITVSASGASGSPSTVFDTLVVTAPPPPIVMSVSPAFRRATVQQGTAAPGDNAAVTLSGTGSSSAAWSATKRKAWTSLVSSSGTGSGTVSWTRNTTGLTTGTYVDTITVTSSGATGSPGTIYDTLVITAPPPPLALAISPTSRRATITQGGTAPGDNASVTFTGTGAGSATWSATKRQAWTTLVSSSGTGNGTVSWTRNASGLAAGTYVDTISINAAGATGSPSAIYDTLVVNAPAAPLVLAVAPSSRRATVVQGSGVNPSDNAAITLSGTGAPSATWSATKRQAWNNLDVASGTGSGTVSWTRNTAGLTVGTYVDTITVASAGASGSGTIYDTLVVTAPLSIAVTPSSRITTVQQGGAAAGDNAAVTLAGSGASSTTWTATKRKSWTTLVGASGTGSGTLSWTRNAAGLSAGTYVDTLTISMASGTPAVLYDTLIVTAAPGQTFLAVSPASRRVTVTQGTVAPEVTATVTISGAAAGSASWTVSKRQSWTGITSGSGVGTGTAGWMRSAVGLTPGTYVDTISVTSPGAIGSPGMVIDTMVVTALLQPLTLDVSPNSRTTTVIQGGTAAGDNATVTLSGTGSSTAPWSATKRKSWTTLTSAAGVGSGVVSWNRNAAGLAAGTYVDTITVTAVGAVGSPETVFDTLVVTAASAPLAIAVSPAGRRTSVVQGGVALGDNASVTLTGTGAGTALWTATKRKSWTTLAASSGVGNGTVSWTRNPTGLAVGTYVDTIAVAAVGATGSPATVFDTLVVTASTPLVLAVSPAARKVSIDQGTTAPGDNASVTLTGTGASTASWTATKRKSWTTLSTPSGTGNGMVTWTRTTSGLAVGTYVDTITVTVAGANGSPATVFDTITVLAAPVPVKVKVAPPSRKASIAQGASAPSDNGVVTLTGDNSASLHWTATKRKSWTTLTTSSGNGAGTVAWNRNTSGLAAGTYVDTITVAVADGSVAPALIVDSVVVQEPVNVVPKGKKFRVVTSNGPASILGPVVDSAQVVGSVMDGQSDVWMASSPANWLQLTTNGGHLNDWIRWQRLPSLVGPGMHIDTVRIQLQANPALETIMIDTLEVVAVAAPAPGSAVDDLFRPGSITDDQRLLLDREGNNNGRYDLGDFLAWVDRNHIKLNASVMTKVQGLMKAQSAPAAKPAGSGGGQLP